MKTLPFFATLTLSGRIHSPDLYLPDALPKTREDFLHTESIVLGAIDWLENTPLVARSGQRKLFNAYVVVWITNAPTLTINLNARVVPMSKQNPDLLFAFMGGWTRYALQNGYSRDPVQCNFAGLKSLIKVYNANIGHGIKKDQGVERLVDLDQKGALQNWVKDQV